MASARSTDSLTQAAQSGSEGATGTLPPRIFAHLARALRPPALAKAFAAQVFDAHGRAEIFREHLWLLFPHSAAAVAKLVLPARHDYTKMLAFTEAGRWPAATHPQLPHVFAQLMGPLLEEAKTAYIAPLLRKAGPMASAIAPSLERVWESVARARLEGARSLSLRHLAAVAELPEHLWTLGALRDLSLQHMEGRRLPAALAKLTHLQHLQLHEASHLVTLPDSMAKMSQLKGVRLTGSRFSRRFTLPQFLAQMPRLAAINVGKLQMQRPAWLPAHIAFEKDSEPSDRAQNV